ncbi:radical SAM/SPASM domain-containing protein [Halobacteriovorax marinus]|nr:SPASM domain-containing protein [Halobacteriovorax marinus]
MFKLSRGMFSVVEIEINSHCNMACSYCPNSEHERLEKGEMSTETFIRIMQQLKEIEFKGRVSYHFYNEPLLCKKLDEFVVLTKEFLPSCIIDIYSNGTLLTKKRLEKLFELGVDKFTITEHEGTKPGYIFKKVYKDLDEAQKKKVHFQGHEKLDLSNRGGLLEHLSTQDISSVPCYIPLYLVVITLNGNVLPCYDDFYQNHSMGNIHDQHIEEIWNSEKYNNFRKLLREKNGRKSNPVCEKCTCVRW